MTTPQSSGRDKCGPWLWAQPAQHIFSLASGKKTSTLALGHPETSSGQSAPSIPLATVIALGLGLGPRKSSLEIGLEGTGRREAACAGVAEQVAETSTAGVAIVCHMVTAWLQQSSPKENRQEKRPHSEEPLEPSSHLHFSVSEPINRSTPLFCQSLFDLDFFLAPAPDGILKP